MEDNKGWICPVCGRGVAPNVKVCPCKSEHIYVSYPIYPWIYPSYPDWWKKITCKTNTTYASNTDYTPSNTHTTTTSTNGEK